MPLEPHTLPDQPDDQERGTPAPNETRPGDVKVEIQQSDPEMIRVYEDLIDILMSRNIVLLTDFPPAAQTKLLRRRQMRAMLAPLSDLVSSDEDQGMP